MGWDLFLASATADLTAKKSLSLPASPLLSHPFG